MTFLCLLLVCFTFGSKTKSGKEKNLKQKCNAVGLSQREDFIRTYR